MPPDAYRTGQAVQAVEDREDKTFLFLFFTLLPHV